MGSKFNLLTDFLEGRESYAENKEQKKEEKFSLQKREKLTRLKFEGGGSEKLETKYFFSTCKMLVFNVVQN